ncbi:hypothetical protein MASR2M15_00600 [Anaerolineales bacterium]
MFHIKKLTRDNETPSFSPRQLISILAYYHWLNTQVIIADVSFSEIYSRMQVKAVENSDTVEIYFDEHGLEMNLPSDPQILFQFCDITSSRIEEFLHDNPQIVEEFTIEDMGKRLFDDWKRRSKKLLKSEHKVEREFRKHLSKLWQPTLTLLEILISTSREKSEEFYDIHYPTVDKSDAVVLGLARRLFSRAIQISLEIHLLLSHGFADGAEARWRTLYETMVICTFIIRTGHKTALRYILHEAVVSYNIIKTHDEVHKKNGSIFISDEELAEHKKRNDEVINIFGNDFKYDYAWAASALPQIKGRIKFQHLENFTEYNYLYPLHKDASGNIHSSSRSNYVPLAAPYNDHSIVIAGPSVFGIGEVTRNTAFILFIFLANILSAVQSRENEAHVVAMYELWNQLREECARADRELGEMANTWPEDTRLDQDFLSFSIDDLK